IANCPFWKRKPELRVARKLKSVSVQCQTERTFSLWNALMVFRFSVRRLCETIACSMFEAQKPLVQLRMWHLMHADAKHSQAGRQRNCATPATTDLSCQTRGRRRN